MVHPVLAAVGVNVIIKIAKVRGELAEIRAARRYVRQALGDINALPVLDGVRDFISNPHPEHEPADK